MRRVAVVSLVATLLATVLLACSDSSSGPTPFDGQTPLLSGTIRSLTPGMAFVADSGCGANVTYDSGTIVYRDGDRATWQDLRAGQRVSVFGFWGGTKPCPPPATATGIVILQ